VRLVEGVRHLAGIAGRPATVVTREDNHILKHAKAVLHLKWAYSAAADVLDCD